MMNSVNMDRDQWQMGKTKLFVKAPESVRQLLPFACIYIHTRIHLYTSSGMYLRVCVSWNHNRTVE